MLEAQIQFVKNFVKFYLSKNSKATFKTQLKRTLTFSHKNKTLLI